MSKTIKRVSKQAAATSPLLTATERRKVWEQAKGMWTRRKPDPIHELEQQRSEWRTI